MWVQEETFNPIAVTNDTNEILYILTKIFYQEQDTTQGQF